MKQKFKFAGSSGAVRIIALVLVVHFIGKTERMSGEKDKENNCN